MSKFKKIMTGLNAVDAMIERKNRRIIEQNNTINRQANMLRGMIEARNISEFRVRELQVEVTELREACFEREKELRKI